MASTADRQGRRYRKWWQQTPLVRFPWEWVEDTATRPWHSKKRRERAAQSALDQASDQSSAEAPELVDPFPAVKRYLEAVNEAQQHWRTCDPSDCDPEKIERLHSLLDDAEQHLEPFRARNAAGMRLTEHSHIAESLICYVRDFDPSDGPYPIDSPAMTFDLTDDLFIGSVVRCLRSGHPKRDDLVRWMQEHSRTGMDWFDTHPSGSNDGAGPSLGYTPRQRPAIDQRRSV